MEHHNYELPVEGNRKVMSGILDLGTAAQLDGFENEDVTTYRT